jgi:hypothetical protein
LVTLPLNGGKTYGLPYRAILVKGLGNSRDLAYGELHDALKLGNVWFDAETPYRPS